MTSYQCDYSQHNTVQLHQWTVNLFVVLYISNMFFMPFEICTCEVKGMRQWRLLFYGELFRLMCFNITIVAVKCLRSKGATMIN